MNALEAFRHADKLRQEGKFSECKIWMVDAVGRDEMLTSDLRVIAQRIAKDEAQKQEALGL